jgi:hypothetical protein
MGPEGRRPAHPLLYARRVARLVLEAQPSDRPIMLLQGGGGNQVNPAITGEGNP